MAKRTARIAKSRRRVRSLSRGADGIMQLTLGFRGCLRMQTRRKQAAFPIFRTATPQALSQSWSCSWGKHPAGCCRFFRPISKVHGGWEICGQLVVGHEWWEGGEREREMWKAKRINAQFDQCHQAVSPGQTQQCELKSERCHSDDKNPSYVVSWVQTPTCWADRLVILANSAKMPHWNVAQGFLEYRRGLGE